MSNFAADPKLSLGGPNMFSDLSSRISTMTVISYQHPLNLKATLINKLGELQCYLCCSYGMSLCLFHFVVFVMKPKFFFRFTET